MITDRIGQHEVLLPSNHDYNKMYEIFFFFKLKHKNFRVSFAGSEKKPFAYARARVRRRVLSFKYCPISAEIRTVVSQSDLLILL